MPKRTRKILFQCLSVLSLSALLAACNSGSQSGSSSSSSPSQSLTLSPAPSFNADSAYRWVAKQVAFGPRIPNTPAQQQCADWLISKMRQFADSVSVQRTQVSGPAGQSLRCINIIGHINPQARTRILILAHWDTRPFADGNPATRRQHFDGADDGGSGVGVILELARQMHLKHPNVGVDLLLTDAEDYGVDGNDNSWGLGTQYWARKAVASGYKAEYGILLDMVGGKGAHFYREYMTKHYADAPSRMLWNVANQIGYSDYFRYDNLGNAGITDDHVFVNQIAHIPTMDIIALGADGSFMPWHHTLADNMQIIDTSTLKAVGQTVLQVIYSNPPY